MAALNAMPMFGACTSASALSARRKHRERISPTAGPPRTLTISAVLPPSSDTGKICVTLVVSCRRCPVSQCTIIFSAASWSLPSAGLTSGLTSAYRRALIGLCEEDCLQTVWHEWMTLR